MNRAPGVYWRSLNGRCPASVAAEWLNVLERQHWDAALLSLEGDGLTRPGVVVVPDGTWRDGVWEHLMAKVPAQVSAESDPPGSVSGLKASPSAGVWTLGRLFDRLARHPLGTSESLPRPTIVEAGRAVAAAIQAGGRQFPWLSQSPKGPSLPEDLADLLSEIGYGRLHSRSPGTITALSKLQPPALGQELLTALGMMEGALERLAAKGRRSTWSLRQNALSEFEAAQSREGLPASYCVVGFEDMDQLTVDALRALGRHAHVLVLVPGSPGDDGLAASHGNPLEARSGGLGRALSWLGAVRVHERLLDGDSPDAEESVVRSEQERATASMVIERRQAAGPMDAASDAVEAVLESAGEDGTAVIVTPRPAQWVPFLEEACATKGLWLVGACGPELPGWGIRFIHHLVRAWTLGLTAARATDLVHLGTLLRLGEGPESAPLAAAVGRPRRRRLGQGRGPAPEPWDQLDWRLRRRGVRRGVGVIGRVGGDTSALVTSVYARLEAAESVSARLEAVASICRDMGFWRRCLTAAALVAGRETQELAGLARALDGLASDLVSMWPEGLVVADEPRTFADRVAAAMSSVRSRDEWRVAPPGVPSSACVRLQSPAHVIGPGVDHLVCLDLTESEVQRLGRSPTSSLIPDSVRTDPEVATLAHLPVGRESGRHAQARLMSDLSRFADPTRAGRVTAIIAERDVQGRETVPWAWLDAHKGATSPAIGVPLSRQQRHRPVPVSVRRGPKLGGPKGVAATVVDAYRACPRRFYFERVLGVQDREAVRFDVDSRQRGNWLHALIHQLFVRYPRWWREHDDPSVLARLLTGLPLRPRDRLVTGASDPFLRLQRAALIDKAAARLVEHGALLRAQAGPERRRFPEMAVVGLEIGMRAAAETSGPPLLLRGTLDRLDLIFDRRGRVVGSVVIDYKTGHLGPYGLSAGAAEGQMDAQERLQLLLYAHLSERMLKIPCLGAVAVPVLDPGRPRGVVLADPTMPAAAAWLDAVGTGDVVDARQFRGAIEGAVAAAQEVVASVAAGRFAAEPRTDRECGFCAQSLYCERVRR